MEEEKKGVESTEKETPNELLLSLLNQDIENDKLLDDHLGAIIGSREISPKNSTN